MLPADHAIAPAAGPARGPDRSVLARIHEPTVSLAIWERPPPLALLRGMERLRPGALPHGRLLVSVEDAHAGLSALVAASPLAGTLLGQALIADMLMLTEQFALLAGTDHVDIRLDRLRHDACWKFHRDQVRLRLLTTYRRAATEIVPPSWADVALHEQRAYEGPLEHVPDGAVTLFKGARAADGDGIVHRSPAIAGTGATRSLLCLNLPSDTSPPRWEPAAPS